MAYYTPDDITNILLQTYHKTKQSQAGNELIIKFKTAELNDLLVNSLFTDNSLGISKILSIAQSGDNYEITASASYNKNLDLDAILQALNSNDCVIHAEQDTTIKAFGVSNDPGYTNGSLWGMTDGFGSNADLAWAAGYTGNMNTIMGIIDTGIDYTHQDLYLNIWLNQNEIPIAIKSVLKDTDSDGLITFRDLNQYANSGYVLDKNGTGYIDGGDLLADSRWENHTDQDSNGYTDDLIGWDFANNDNDPYDDNEHGTHVAGTIGGIGGNGKGVVGINWAIQMPALKFLDYNGEGDTSDAVAALDYYNQLVLNATDVENFVGTNNSWGGGEYSAILQDSIVQSALENQLFIAAAGNESTNNDYVENWPSNYDTTFEAGFDAVICVASLEEDGSMSDFSNYGATTVDLGAPGGYIYSSVPGGYDFFSGTSMATPATAGAVALYASQNQDASAAQIKEALLGSVDLTSSLIDKTVTGGRLDIWSLLNKLAPPPDDATAPEIVLSTVELSSKGAILKILFDQELDSDILPESTSFTIKIDGKSIKPDSFSLIDGDARALEFVLPTTPLENQSIVVSYKDPSAQNDISYVLQAADSGLDVATFADMSFDYNIDIDNTAPILLAATTDDVAHLRLAFDEPLKETHLMNVSNLTITVGGQKATIDFATVDSQTGELLVMLKDYYEGEDLSDYVIRVNYKDPTTKNDINALQDWYGNDVGSFETAYAPEGMDVTGPMMSDGYIVGDYAFTVLNEYYDSSVVTNSQIKSLFTALDANNKKITISDIDASNSDMNFVGVVTFAAGVAFNDTMTLTYEDKKTIDQTKGIIQDMSGNDMPTESLTSWSSYDIGSDSSSDKMVVTSGDAAVGSSLIHLYFENINISASDGNSNLEAITNQVLSRYTVVQGTKKLTISDIYIADDSIDELGNSYITIVLKTALTSNASLKVTYKDTSAKDDALALQDLFGNDVSGFSYTVDVDMTSSDATTIAQALIGISVGDVIQ